MKTYKIAYTYNLYGTVNVEAPSLEEARELAMRLSIDNRENEHYLDESFQIDEDGTAHYNPED
jgi:hypothetical protein